MILSAPPTESMILSALFGCVITAAATKKKLAILTIADLPLWSTVPKRRRRSVCRRRGLSFATLQANCQWGINAAVPYCGCILIPLQAVGWLVSWSVGRSVGRSLVSRSVHNKGSRALGGFPPKG
jgi:hypothetical protein